MKPPVGIVIVNHNLKDSLRETLESFQRVDYPNLNVVVVDNASTDGSQKMVRKEFPRVRLAEEFTEQGYAKAASMGMSALSHTCKYIFSTTNDVIVDPNIINELVDYAESHPDVAILGCKIYYAQTFYHQSPTIWHAGGHINPIHGHSSHYGWNRKDAPRYNTPRECDFVTGCGLFIRSYVAQEMGYFNSRLVFYCEDADLCYRVREQGYKIVYLPTAILWHKTSTTLAKNRPLQLHYSTRNSLYLLEWHRIGCYPLSLLVYLFAVCPAKMLLFLLLGRWRNAVGISHGVADWLNQEIGWIV